MLGCNRGRGLQVVGFNSGEGAGKLSPAYIWAVALSTKQNGTHTNSSTYFRRSSSYIHYICIYFKNSGNTSEKLTEVVGQYKNCGSPLSNLKSLLIRNI